MRRAIISTLAAGGLILSSAASTLAAVEPSPETCAHPNGHVSAIAFGGSTAYLGGTFTAVTDRSGKTNARAGLAAIDISTCDLLPWTASADGAVNALAVAGGSLYLGGTFTHVNGTARSYLAAVSASDGTLQSFNHTVDTPIRALAATSTTVFAGGDLTRVDTTARSGLAAFDVSSGALVSGWAPSVNRAVDVMALSPDGSTLYFGGTFTRVNDDTSRQRLAAVTTSTAALTAFAPDVPDPVLAVDADAQGVYAGTGGPGGHLLLLNLNGSAKWPTFQTDGGVQAVVASGDSVYAGGHFGNYCVGGGGSGTPFICTTNLRRSKIMEVSKSTGAVTSWAPELNSAHGVYSTEVDASGALWVGGDFTKVDGDTTQAHLAVFPAGGTTPPPTTTVPSAPTGLSATAGDGSVALTWQAPSSNGGSAITGYNVYRATGGGSMAKLTSVTGTSYTDNGVTNGTTYSYTVKAVNAVGEGPASSTATATPTAGTTNPTAPSAPTALTAAAGDGSVALTWQAPSSNGGSAITGYNVYRATGGGSMAKLTSVNGTSYTDNGVTNGTTYSYTVKAVNAVGEGAASSTATATPSAGTTTGGPCGTKVGQTAVINHVIMLIFENKSRTQVIGQSYAPYLNSLADECGQATNMQALSNTSLANYIALTSGYTGHPTEITSNRDPSVWPQDTVSIFEQLGTDARELSEDAGGNCWNSTQPDTFTVNHTPFPYYTRIPALCKTQDVPLTDPMDLSAKFTLLTPNKPDIMHRDPNQPNLTVAQKVAIGDKWASVWVPKVLASPQYKNGDTVLIIGFDEGNGKTFNIPFIVVSPYTPVGYTTTVRLDHYSTLRGVQEMLGLPLLGNAKTSTTSIRSYFGLGG